MEFVCSSGLFTNTFGNFSDSKGRTGELHRWALKPKFIHCSRTYEKLHFEALQI